MHEVPKHCDAVLRRGDVIDPAQGLWAIRDVGIADGRIAAVEEDLSWLVADHTLDVSGKYVTPGLIDLHTHVYADGSVYGIEADELCPRSGVTTAVDAGSAGWVNFRGFRRYVIRPSETRILAFVNLSAIGLICERGEFRNEDYIRPDEAARVVLQNPDVAVGIKIRICKGAGGEADSPDLLRTAIDAAERCGKPLMLHTTGTEVPLEELLPMLRPGDILTHCFNGLQHSILDKNGKIRPEVWAARERGVIFDVGHGRGSFSFEVTRLALQEGFAPDTISTDAHRWSIDGPVYDLPTTMSKFLALGMSLQEVIQRSTTAPAVVIGRDETLGSLRVGAPADIAVLELQDGSFPFQDCHKRVLVGDRRLVCVTSLRDGKIWYSGDGFDSDEV